MEIKEVMVVGAGIMGSGIAQTLAQYGYPAILWGISEAELRLSLDNIDGSLERFARKGRLTSSKERILGRIRTTVNIAEGREADFVIETVVEDLKIKEEIFQTLDQTVKAGAILASNTSSIPITRLARVTRRPEKVVGLHFSNPVPLMPVAEVIRTIATSAETFDASVALAESLHKEVIRVNFDLAGFVLNRVNLPGNVEAILLVERGMASIEDIDKAMRLGFGRPMGPFETMDLVGLDTGYKVLLSLYEETKDTKFLPPDLLRRKVWLGEIGRKVGRGWYVYGPQGEKIGPAG
ncbi:MAG: 3-hydroxyacyl-CoA dehydrogenase family protein [Thermodesulfobacteriota bacterium]